MKNNFKYILLLLLIVAVALLANCTKEPTSATNDVSIELEFVMDHNIQLKLDNQFIKPELIKNKINYEFKKELALQSIDEAKIMILDFSIYDSSSQYFNSDDYDEYVKERNEWTGDQSRWDQWVKFLGDYFRIVVNQNLTIEDDHAKGTVSGVIGLNYICVALLENGRRIYWGEGDVTTEKGETKQTRIYVQEVYNP